MMGSGHIKETHLDDTPMATGTHDGADNASVLRDIGAHFLSCGIHADQYIENETDGSSGAVVSCTEDTVTCTLTGGSTNKWNKGDTYSIYVSDTKDSVLATINTDRRFGRKVTAKDSLVSGLFPDDIDEDEYEGRR